MPESAASDIQCPDALGRFRGAAALILGERWRYDRLFRVGVALAPHDPLVGDLQGAYLLEPGGRYLLGTQGRDVLSRGLVAGYYQRWVDATVMRLADALRDAFDPKARSEG